MCNYFDSCVYLYFRLFALLDRKARKRESVAESEMRSIEIKSSNLAPVLNFVSHLGLPTLVKLSLRCSLRSNCKRRKFNGNWFMFRSVPWIASLKWSWGIARVLIGDSNPRRNPARSAAPTMRVLMQSLCSHRGEQRWRSFIDASSIYTSID